MSITLLCIAKAPTPGAVKTRLCPPASPEQAAELAEAALCDTLEAMGAVDGGRCVVALEGEPGPWLPEGMEVVPQVGGGLDRRLAGAFAHAGGPALLVGMDTPQVTSALLSAAADALARPGVGAVLGPALDGGYWAIGLRRPSPAVFIGVPMSRKGTGDAQRRRLQSLGLRWEELTALRDVDRIDDARAVARSCPESRFARALAAAGLDGLPDTA